MRQAIAYALNREQLVKTQLPEGAKVGRRSSCPDTVAGYTDGRADRTPTTRTRPRQLLAEAGAEGT